MEDFETIAIFNYSHEIVVLKHLLEQEGIHYYFENETTFRRCSFLHNSFGRNQIKSTSKRF